MKTIIAKQLKTEDRNWYIIDAKDKTLWRLATLIAVKLKGKHKVDFTPHLDNGDYVVVTNADKFKVTWNKLSDKIYYKHSGYLWGLKETSLEKLLLKKPTLALEHAVNWMLPKNKLRKNMLARLKLVTWDEHKYAAQKPEEINYN